MTKIIFRIKKKKNRSGSALVSCWPLEIVVGSSSLDRNVGYFYKGVGKEREKGIKIESKTLKICTV